ncbi:unnamed protein product [Mortierella alpina]
MSATERRSVNGTNDSGRSDDTAVSQDIMELMAFTAVTDTLKVDEKPDKEGLEMVEPEEQVPEDESLQEEEPEGDEPEGEEETQEELVTPEVLAWRETINSTLTLDTAMRYYLKKADDTLFLSYGSPLAPVPIISGADFLAFLNTRGVAPGWYWVVFGVCFKDTNGSMLENIELEVLNGDVDANFYTMIHPCAAVVENAEFADLPKDEFARLRLHRQIQISDEDDDCLWVQIALKAVAGSEKEVSFDLHYIELASPKFKSATGVKDHVLWGEGKPDQFVRVGAHAATDAKKPISIAAYDFSVFGTYAATLYFTANEAHIDIWDLRTSDQLISTGKPQAIATPLAHTSFPVSTEFTTYDALRKAELQVSISSAGSQVVMGYVDESEQALPLQIYRCSPTAPADRDLSEPWELEKVPRTSESLQNYFGYGSFHISDMDDLKPEKERYFTFNGAEFDLYSTDGEWVQLYSLPLGVDKDQFIRRKNMESLREGLRGRYFPWTGDKGGVSIWDFETGKFVTAILIPEDTGHVRAALSADGSMIAISVNASVQVHDVVSGIKLGVYKAGSRDDNELEVVFGQDHFIALNSALSSSVESNIDAHSVIRVHDMSIVKTHIVYWQYETEFPTFGATLNIKRIPNLLTPTEIDDCGPDNACELQDTPLNLFYNSWTGQYTSSIGATFDVGADYVYSRGLYVRELTITNSSVKATISLGLASKDYQGFFMAASSQLVLIMNGFLQVWRLPSKGSQRFELIHVEAYVDVPEVHLKDSCITEVVSAQSCEHGRRFSVEFKPIKWVRGLNGEEIKDESDSGEPQMLIFPRAVDDTFSKTETYRYQNGVASLLDTYADSGLIIKEAIIRFLASNIRPSMAQPISSLVILCRSWKPTNRAVFEAMIADLLPATRITWIPDINAAKDDDPLSILTETSKRHPTVLGACKIIMNYCVSHAVGSMNLSFLSPLFQSMHDIMDLFPEEALECMARIAYIPVRRREYILENHVVAHSPRRRLQFWKSPCKSLDQIKDPVMQLYVTPEPPRMRVDTFTRPIFMASFDALWQYKDIDETKKDVLEEAMLTQQTTWWKTLYHIIRLKFHLKTHTYVECHEFSLEFFDNPTIAALVAYKWNTIGYAYWASRFLFQSIFYVLVVGATLMQVYHEYVDRSHLAGVFIAIIVVAAVFLWLELLQAVKNFGRYSGTMYNFLDIAAYTLSIASSIDMLVILENDDSAANTRSLSFTVLVVFLHTLFELRIYKSVCKYVTIIRESVAEIRAFFFIFAGGLVAFTIATLHLLRACPTPGACEEPTTKFEGHFIGALSATYFFMGGRYDPVQDEFGSQDWGFHLMMMVYFFFTVIVMLNVLIALINVAFAKGDDGWRLAWIESRLRYIEAAENLSYHIPGFRQSHNCFPKEIYFSATSQQVRAYHKKYRAKYNNPEDLSQPEDWAVRDDQAYENDGYDVQGEARLPAPTKMEEAAVQEKDNMSVTSDVREQLQREVVSTELRSSEIVEEEADASEVKGQGSIRDDCAVEELKAQPSYDPTMTRIAAPYTAGKGTNPCCSNHATEIREVCVVIDEDFLSSTSSDGEEEGTDTELEKGAANAEFVEDDLVGPEHTRLVEGTDPELELLEEPKPPVEVTSTSQQEVSMRVYFTHEQKIYTPQNELTKSVAINSCDGFEASLNTGSLRAGWYSAVFCVSLEGVPEGALNNIAFDLTRRIRVKGIALTKKYTCGMDVAKDEIDSIPKTGHLRLRLHRQIAIIPESNMKMSIKVATAPGQGQNVSFELFYFELSCLDFASEDRVLWGKGKPEQLISIVTKDGEGDKTPITIEASDFSDNGKLAVTVHFTNEADIPTRGTSSKPEATPAPREALALIDAPAAGEALTAKNAHISIALPATKDLPATKNLPAIKDLLATKDLPAMTDTSPVPADPGTRDASRVRSAFRKPAAFFKGGTGSSGAAHTQSVTHINVWNLCPPSEHTTGYPQVLTKPLATMTIFNSFPADCLKEAKPLVNISGTGSQVVMALGSVKTSKHLTPFVIFKLERPENPSEPSAAPVRRPKQTADRFKDVGGRSSSTPVYKQASKTCQSLQDFFGFGSFHMTDQYGHNPENERYFNIHGSRIDVYSISDGWKQMYSHDFGINDAPRISYYMLQLRQSLRGRYFAWTGDRGSVSICDFETGKRVTVIFIPNARVVRAAFSEDESLIAISLDGTIQVHDVISGIHLGAHKAKWKDGEFEKIIGRDYFDASDAPLSTVLNRTNDAISILEVRNTRVIKARGVFWQYGAGFPSTWDAIFSYRQGATVNIKRLGNIFSPFEVRDCGPDDTCELQHASTDFFLTNNKVNQSLYNTGTTRNKEIYNLHSFEPFPSELNITKEGVKTIISLGPAFKVYQGFFIEASCRVVLIMSGFLQVWRLPYAANPVYELVHVEAFMEVTEARTKDRCITEAKLVRSCAHGRRFSVALNPVKWIGPSGEELEDDLDNKEPMLTFPRTAGDTFSTNERYRNENGIASLIDTYTNSDPGIKEAIISFLANRIRPSSKYSSSLVILCRSWKCGNRAILEEIIAKLLPAKDRITWIPDSNATKREDPLSILTKFAKKNPSDHVLGVCSIIMDYCVAHAINSKNMSLLSPFLRNLKNIVALFPDEAQVYLRKIAHITVDDRSRDRIIENSTVSRPPWHCIQFWKSRSGVKDRVMRYHVTKERLRDDARWRKYIIERIIAFSHWQAKRFKMTTLSLDHIKDLAQIHVSAGRSHNSEDSLKQDLCVASFDALWHYKDITESQEKGAKVTTNRQEFTIKEQKKLMNMVYDIEDIRNEVSEAQRPTKISAVAQGQETGAKQEGMTPWSWWRVPYYMLKLKLHLQPHNYVRCHKFELEFFDNPAIAALVDYKWNTIGYAYWAFRFFFQCVFYGLVIAAALLQVYHERVGRSQLVGVFIAIIAMGFMYLWLEFLQAIRNFKRYSRTMYNFVDIVAYSMPIVASVDMLVALYNNNPVANSRSVSFSVLAIFHHMLFELRIYKSVCKYVSIIRQSVVEIRVFLFIFAGGLVAFAISTLHLLRACTIPGSCKKPTTKFSEHFLGALSSTFFFMGGRFDPVADELGSEDWDFHVMLGVFFFFTVIVMLNVLIALINKAFKKGDNAWRLDWVQARLNYIELAENLSYHIPGFRQNHDWFPKEIYFTATAKEDAKHREETLKTQILELEKQLAEQKELVQKQVASQQKLIDLVALGHSKGSKAETENT